MKHPFLITLSIVFFATVFFAITLSPTALSPRFVDYLYQLNTPTSTTPVPPPPTITDYNPPTLPQKDSYTLILIGDSMTEALGINSDLLRIKLKEHYPNTTFGIFNYGVPSSSVLSLNDRLTDETNIQGQTYPPVLGRQFDVIIIESFGHNPLSEYSLEEGLAVQNRILDEAVSKINYTHPESVIVFLATIGVSKTQYSLNSRNLDQQTREKWAIERAFYIENHINYAKNHNIPLINAFHPSLIGDTVDLKYINHDDYIHPSLEGIDLISGSIANFLDESHIIPIPR